MTNQEKLAYIEENYLYSRRFELSENKEQVFSEWKKSILSSAPKRLYKYRVCNENNLNSLKSRKAWFSDPNTWNDPIDVTALYNIDEDIKSLNEHLDDYIIKFTYNLINQYIASCCEQNKFVALDKVKFVYYSIFKGKNKFMPEKMVVALEPVVGLKLAKKITVKTQECFAMVLSPEFKKTMLNIINQFFGFNAIKNETLMYSLSESFENNHQWAMYADGGKGFCIGYKLRIDNSRDETLLHNLLPIYYGKKVELRLCRIIEESLKYCKKPESLSNYLNQEAKNLWVSLYTKAPEWNGEQEWRFAMMKTQSKSNLVNFDYADSIYLGDKISEEWKMKLIEIAKDQNLQVYQRELDGMKSKWIYKSLEIKHKRDRNL